MKCSHSDCQCDAWRAPKLMVPLKDSHYENPEPLGILLGSCLCETHIRELSVKSIFHNDKRLKHIFVILSRGVSLPDFERAYIVHVPLTSTAWLNFRKIMDRQAHGQASH